MMEVLASPISLGCGFDSRHVGRRAKLSAREMVCPMALPRVYKKIALLANNGIAPTAQAKIKGCAGESGALRRGGLGTSPFDFLSNRPQIC